ncbi:MAG: DUF4091 domain-containing protein [Planctomycetota bacterium]|nr:DUF4091 domain-containing protein [Planctomycetota bacterium]
MRTGILSVLVVLFILQHAHAAEPALWVESPGTMILPDRVPGGGGAIERTGVRNEYVCAQLALRAAESLNGPLHFEWTALKGPAGEIAKEHVRLFRAADISVTHGDKVDEQKDPRRIRRMGAYPDALVPLVKRDGTSVANAIALEKDRTAAFWVDIFLPAGAKPGTYEGAIALKGEGVNRTVPVKITVLNLEIPADATLPSLFDLRFHPHVKEHMDAYVEEALAHRVQPFNYHYEDFAFNSGFGFEFLDKLNPGGRGFACVYLWDSRPPAPARATQIVENLKKITAHLKEKKLFEKSYLYLKDEPSGEEIKAAEAVAKLVLDALPEWKGKLLCTLNTEGTGLDALLTHHVRALKIYGPWYMQINPPGGREAWDKRRAEGQQLWFYVSNAQGFPFPTFDVHTANMGFEPRVLGWGYWYEKAGGHLYWDLLYEPKWTLNERFPPGDGQLIYPGDFSLAGAPAWVQVKDLEGPVVSRRLKMQREGLEEWELLRMAEAKAGRAKVQAIVEKVYTCLGRRTWAPDAYDPKQPMWSYDEAAWDQAREQVLGLLK